MFGGWVGELEDAHSLASVAAGQRQLICHFAQQQADDVGSFDGACGAEDGEAYALSQLRAGDRDDPA